MEQELLRKYFCDDVKYFLFFNQAVFLSLHLNIPIKSFIFSLQPYIFVETESLSV